MSDLIHPIINSPGLLLASGYFDQKENYFLKLLHEYGCLYFNDFNYGLLPGGSPEIRVVGDKLEVEKFSLSHKNGWLIRYDSQLHDSVLQVRVNDSLFNAGRLNPFYLILRANPYEREVAFSRLEQDTEEHYHFAKPKMELVIVPESKLEGRQVRSAKIILAKLTVGKKGINVDEEYIPPVALVTGHPFLWGKYCHFVESLTVLKQASKDIVQKCKSIPHMERSLARNLKELAADVCSFLVPVCTKFDFWKKRKNDLVLFDLFMVYYQLFDVINERINMLDRTERAELVGHLCKWTPDKMQPVDLSAFLEAIKFHDYDHTNIGGHLSWLDQILQVLIPLFKSVTPELPHSIIKSVRQKVDWDASPVN